MGHIPHVMVTVQHEASFRNDFNLPKFKIEQEKRSFHLKIAEVEPSDEAMYFCGYMKFTTEFINGTFLTVKGKNYTASLSNCND